MEKRWSAERLAAGLQLSGISRKEAAGLLFISQSQLNKKLRGSARLYEEERRALIGLISRKGVREGRP